jgi:hypothetical protein
MYNLSASQLIKSSLAQMVYLTKRRIQKPVTKAQIEGNKYAEQVSKGLPQELRGTVRYDMFTIFFCLDALGGDTAMEIKNVEGEYEDWYFKSSLIQTSLYFSLLDKVSYLDTPAFRRKEGYDEIFVDLKENPIHHYHLLFGEHFVLSVSKNEDVYKHYIRKAYMFCEAMAHDWEEAMYTAKKWDSKYKFKELDLFTVDYEKLNTNEHQLNKNYYG